MRRFWRLASRPVHLPFVDSAEDAYRAFSPLGRGLFLFFAILMVGSSFGLLAIVNTSLRVSVPGYGGSFSEGIVGSPRFINPVLAVSDADHDLSRLVYSGLVKPTVGGEYVPDLAQSYTLSDDGKVYTFTLREGLTFHDNKPVTAADIVFTITKIQEGALKSPARANWDGIQVEVVDARTVRFTLASPYAPFIKNATVGILPEHLWKGVSAEEFPFSDLNTSPIGTGPFEVDTVERTPSGIPASYTLTPFRNYALGQPYLSEFIVHFYQNEEALLTALKRGDIEAASGISPASVSELKNEHIERSALNRVFGVFFNQNESVVLRDKDVRAALNEAVDREALVRDVLQGYGVALEGPVPPGIIGSETPLHTSAGDPALSAREGLLNAGWKLNDSGVLTKTTGKGKDEETIELSFSISTGNVPELRAAAEFVKNAWERMGAKVEVKVFDQGDLSQNVIRPRKYDALLFGEVVGRELDLYAFWDSSQRNDPGLNISLYANATADRLLKEIRETSEASKRVALYKQFEAEIQKDIPAVFLYAPDFVYSVPNDVLGLHLGFIESPSDRFLSAAAWHREEDYVWKVFAR
ncbi:MAG: peptide ABC transporter substrate-binding protein [Candidatus Pacebacteria bacterium]|nr:peptide ABC transporter substrate-binding protein [Candidatus Paceibacterota bacterium]